MGREIDGRREGSGGMGAGGQPRAHHAVRRTGSPQSLGQAIEACLNDSVPATVHSATADTAHCRWQRSDGHFADGDGTLSI